MNRAERKHLRRVNLFLQETKTLRIMLITTVIIYTVL